ncbi:MAG: N-formylglutamate amidohydrolase [Rhizobiaceae bacterium]|nr:N-formylglutamate amidohydrolase [Rhizobiaceae bacterium]
MPEKTAIEPFETINGALGHGIVIVADHAMRRLPESHGTLGLPASELDRHIAYDIGIEPLARALAARLGAPAVLAGFSRLLIDANRGEDDPTLIRRIYDRTVVPGNADLTAGERAWRLETFFRPYHAAINRMIDTVWQATGAPPLVISLHSFTPMLAGGAVRPWHCGLLSDLDRRATDALIALLAHETGLVIGDNEPYDGALKGDTMHTHCTARGIAHALIEVRQDLITHASGVEQWTARLAPAIETVNAMPDMHTVRHFGSRAQ